MEQNKKRVYPCKPQFYYIKVVCKGVFVTRTCFRDVVFAYFFTFTFDVLESAEQSRDRCDDVLYGKPSSMTRIPESLFSTNLELSFNQHYRKQVHI